MWPFKDKDDKRPWYKRIPNPFKSKKTGEVDPKQVLPVNPVVHAGVAIEFRDRPDLNRDIELRVSPNGILHGLYRIGKGAIGVGNGVKEMAMGAVSTVAQVRKSAQHRSAEEVKQEVHNPA